MNPGCMVILAFAVVLSMCDEEDSRKNPRGLYEPKRHLTGEGRRLIYPTDFALTDESGPGGSFHHHHHGYHGTSDFYHDHHHAFENHPLSDVTTYSNETGISLEFAKSISEYSVSDLLLNVIDDAPNIPENPIISTRFGDVFEGNETERNSAQIARPAKCMPELTTVQLIKSNDPNIFYVPECTRIERCGGCCSHVLLACQPVETETVTFSVLKTEYGGGKKLKYVGKEPVIVEKHTKCKCGCKIKAEDCNVYQEYREAECRCLCKNTDEEKKCYKNTSKKLWNPELCACQCREVIPCSTGYQFDYNECRCVQSQFKRRYVISRKEQPEEPPAESEN